MRKTTALLLPVALTALLVPFLAGSASASTAMAGDGACAPDTGVTVVVDLTDLGGQVQVGCAPGDPSTGRQALTDAGFTTTDDATGLICAIAASPDPCPATFEGSYWSYWTAEAGTEWTSYQVGADGSDPLPGSFEGWRYFDGSGGPTVLPAALEAAPSAEPSPEQTVEATAGTGADVAGGGPSPAALAGIGVIAVLLAAAVVLALRRRRANSGDPAGD